MKNHTIFRTIGIRAGLLTGALLPRRLPAATPTSASTSTSSLPTSRRQRRQRNVSVCGDGQLGLRRGVRPRRGQRPRQRVPHHCLLNVSRRLRVGAGRSATTARPTATHKACTAQCLLAVCGDGRSARARPCDDGNNADGDALHQRPHLAPCGDGIVQARSRPAMTATPSTTTPAATPARRPVCGDDVPAGRLASATTAWPTAQPPPAAPTAWPNVCGDGDHRPRASSATTA